jgi:hypothetical protein
MATATQTRKAARNLRNEISSIATYWNNSRDALVRVEEILRAHGLDLGNQIFGREVEHGSFRYTHEIVSDESGEVLDDTMLVFLVFKMQESGRSEITAYLS